jgi:hypothetical protein
MNDAAPTILPILATPLGLTAIAEAEEFNPALLALFSQRIAADTQSRQNPLGYRSRDDLLEWPEQPVQSLMGGMIRGVYSIVGGLNEFTEPQLRSFALEARSWFTVIRTNGSVPAAMYPLTAWCAIYCVAAPPPSTIRADSGVLRLYESRLGTMFQDATNSAMRIPFRTSHYAWRPEPGGLAVFPASLMHEIALLRSPGELVLVTMRLRFVVPGQHGFGRW